MSDFKRTYANLDLLSHMVYAMDPVGDNLNYRQRTMCDLLDEVTHFLREMEQTQPDFEAPKRKQTRKKKPYSDCFENWWKAYPRRIDKERAYKCYQTACKKIAGNMNIELSEAVEWLYMRTCVFAEAVNGTEEQFIKHPATWLTAGSYDSDDDQWKVSRTETTQEKASHDLERILGR